jgi:hypothetical protein
MPRTTSGEQGRLIGTSHIDEEQAMLSANEYDFVTSELAYRRQRIASDWSAAQSRTRGQWRWPTRRRPLR